MITAGGGKGFIASQSCEAGNKKGGAQSPAFRIVPAASFTAAPQDSSASDPSSPEFNSSASKKQRVTLIP